MENKSKMPQKGKVFLIIGLIVGTIGLGLLIFGLVKKVPEIGGESWFDAQVAKSFSISFGGFLTFAGYIMLALMGTITAKKSTPEARAEQIIKMQKANEEVQAILNSKGVEFNMPNKNGYCRYCGSQLGADEKVCSSCGAKLKKSK